MGGKRGEEGGREVEVGRGMKREGGKWRWEGTRVEGRREFRVHCRCTCTSVNSPD